MALSKPRVNITNRNDEGRAMAPFEGFASFFRGGAKATVSAPVRSEKWLRDNAAAIVHLAAISLSKGGATFSFEELLRAAQSASCDIPLSRERVLSVLAEADVERCAETTYRLVA